MQGLTDKITELYQLALDKYDRDAALEKEKYSVLKDADTTDYGRWGDTLNQWTTDRSYLSGRADTELSQAMSIGNTCTSVWRSWGPRAMSLRTRSCGARG